MKRIKFGYYAGVRINGTVETEILESSEHIERACWLTAQVESGGRYGTVISYDGTGMTAGIHQAIAVYPKMLKDALKLNDQGPLWKLLHRIFLGATSDAVDALWLAIGEDAGWYIAPDASLRHLTTGALVSGNDIRNELTGDPSGCMPTGGHARKRAIQWARLFHDAFSATDTFGIQDAFGAEHFVKRAQRDKMRFADTPHYRRKTIADIIYTHRHISSIEWADLGEDVDLAMSFFWSNSVNAPSIAMRKLCQVIPLYHRNPREFAQQLIFALGTAKWGRWHDDIPNGRYQRTRKAAMQVWPRHLFVGADAIMPRDLK